jgi:hypothetical protein
MVFVAILAISSGIEVAAETEVVAGMGTEVIIGIGSTERGPRELKKRGNRRFRSQLKKIGKLRTILNRWIRSIPEIKMEWLTQDKRWRGM